MKYEEKLHVLSKVKKDFLETLDNQYQDKPFLLDLYTVFCNNTRTYPIEADLEHVKNGLTAEVGEVAGVFAKFARGDFDLVERDHRLLKELGDVFYYFIKMCSVLGFDPYMVAVENMDKLIYRFRQNTINGDGDNR